MTPPDTAWLVQLFFKDDGVKHHVELRGNDWTIGRVTANDIAIGRGNCAKRHQMLSIRNDQLLLIDGKSTNGSYVNGKRISGPTPIGMGDVVYISDYSYGLLAPPSPIIDGGCVTRVTWLSRLGSPLGSA